MSACVVLASGTIELLFYDELDEAARGEAHRHLLTCAECRQALEELQVIRTALAAAPDVSAPPGGDWTAFMAGLDAAVRRESADTRVAARAPRRGVRHYAEYIAMAALLALVTMSVAYVARHRTALAGDPAPIARTDPGSEPTPTWTEDAAFASLSEQHFARAKLVVLGLAARNPDDDIGREWEYERELASTLLNDTRLYRLAAEDRGMTALAKIMADLELVLLQVSMTREADAETLQEIQSLIRKRDLVTKMNVAWGS